MDWIKKHKLSVAISLVLIILAGCCLGVYAKMRNTLEYTKAAKKWAGNSGESFAYISCFVAETARIDQQAVYSFKSTLETKLTENSIEAAEGRTLWTFAYCGNGSVYASTDKGSATVEALGVGGDFFFFHPMQLRSGNYIAESDLMHDGVVIDKELAWKLFGAIEVDGMELEISGRKFYVAGVVERDSDFASREAYGKDIGLYMAYDVFNEISGEEINCYELVFPNPVTNFAMNIVKDNFPGGDTAVYVDEGARYGISGIWSVIKDFGKRSMRTDGVIFPYWENAARLTEDYAAAALLLFFVFILVPVIIAAVFVYKYAKKGASVLLGKTKELSVKLCDDMNDRLYEKEQHAKVLEEQRLEEEKKAEEAEADAEKADKDDGNDFSADDLSEEAYSEDSSAD